VADPNTTQVRGHAGLIDAVPVPGSRTASRQAAARRHKLVVLVLRVGLAIGLLVSWQVLSDTNIIDPFFFGSPSGVGRRLWIWITEGTAQGPLWEQVMVTMEETLMGFAIGVVLGVVFGILLGRNRLLSEIFAPYIKALNSIPRVVLGPIFIITLGLGMPSKVALAVVMVFFVVFFNAFQGAREADRNLIANARILGAKGNQVTTEVIIPSAMSWIVASLHTSFGFALVGAVVGEFLGSTKGIGLVIATAQNTFNMNGVYASIFILAAVALVAEAVVTAIENRLIKWRPNALVDVAI
jgi:NitT/TauT family transport system permease protein